LSFPRLRDVPIFSFCMRPPVPTNQIERRRRIRVMAFDYAVPPEILAIAKTPPGQLTNFTSPASQFKVEFL